MDNAAELTGTPLTALAHGGGCGCKLAPALLQELLAGIPAGRAFPNLLVGSDHADDAAIYRLTPDLALVATTDFFTPIVDDPFVFGQIAATNALSDVYAMGGTPVMALALLGMPLGRIDNATVQRILAGGAAMCARAGIPVAGGHSIDSAEPIYGLAAMGTVHPGRILRNGGAREGDVLILTKGLGIGVFSAALKQGRLPPLHYDLMVHTTTQLNSIGSMLGAVPGVHAMTDVTGFGLLGHTLEMCRASGLAARLHLADLPLLDGAAALAESGIATGAAARNWASYGDAVTLPPGLPDWQRGLLCDPQTSGGLLIAAAERDAPALLREIRAAGFARAGVIGALKAGAPGIEVIG
jgi:selenide,water dikinase